VGLLALLAATLDGTGWGWIATPQAERHLNRRQLRPNSLSSLNSIAEADGMSGTNDSQGRWLPASTFIAGCLSLVFGVLVTFGGAQCSNATSAMPTSSDEVSVYFGQGCFWHVQKEFLDKERTELGRSAGSLTALTGYAGGVPSKSPVCYHNYSKIPDYAELGYAEVVGMQIPSNFVGDFARFHLDSISKDAEEKPLYNTGSHSGPFRNVLGLPGGMASPLYPAVEAANAGRLKLVSGKAFVQGKLEEGGNDGDEKTVYVYDTRSFPFKPAEMYHQYFELDNTLEYRGLKTKMLAEKRIFDTGCPEDPLESRQNSANSN